MYVHTSVCAAAHSKIHSLIHACMATIAVVPVPLCCMRRLHVVELVGGMPLACVKVMCSSSSRRQDLYFAWAKQMGTWRTKATKVASHDESSCSHCYWCLGTIWGVEQNMPFTLRLTKQKPVDVPCAM